MREKKFWPDNWYEGYPAYIHWPSVMINLLFYFMCTCVFGFIFMAAFGGLRCWKQHNQRMMKQCLQTGKLEFECESIIYRGRR